MMTNFVPTFNDGQNGKFRNLFKPRDIFLHDGKNLRRFTIGAHIQMAAALAAFVLLAWSAFATIKMSSTMNGDVDQMARQVAAMQADVEAIRRDAQNRAALLERRQAFLAAMLSGEQDPKRLAALLPQQAQPQNAVAQAVSQPYNQVDGMQIMLVERAQDATQERYRETAQMLRRLGLNPARVERAGAVGGPFEAVQPLQNADPRFRELFASWRQLEQLEQGVIAIPSMKPVNVGNYTSGFGVRSDPFRGRAAMHAGIDLAGPIGTPIYATADGIVSRAQYAGAYGNLVEINHGQSIQTRYGHMTRSVVTAGSRVRRGQLIGYMGSTGRSTGSHLHYEVRVDGRAVNPIPYMQSSEVLAAVQRRTAIGTPVAIGGPATGRR